VDRQIKQTREDSRTLHGMAVTLSIAETKLLELEGTNMFISKNRKADFPVPKKQGGDQEFEVQVKKHLWHDGTLRCATGLLYFIEKNHLENAIPYREVEHILVKADSLAHRHKGRLGLKLRHMKDHWMVSAPKDLVWLVRMTIAKAMALNIRIPVHFEKGTQEFDILYETNERNFDEVQLVHNALAAQEAHAGIIVPRDRDSAFESQIYDIAVNLNKQSQAANEALTTHTEELQDQQDLALRVEAHAADITARLDRGNKQDSHTFERQNPPRNTRGKTERQKQGREVTADPVPNN